MGGAGGDVPFTPDTPPPLTEAILDHIIVGEARGNRRGWTGGHGHGERGSPNFPENWDRDRIRDAILRILAAPADLAIERWGSTLHFYGKIDEIPIEVRVRGRAGRPKIWTAVPDPHRRHGKRKS